MAAETRLDVLTDVPKGRDRTLVVRKFFARDGSNGPQQRHRAESQWLQRAVRHPMAQLIEVDHDRLAITTAYGGAATALSTIRSPTDTADLLSAAARALGALHRDRLVHGNLDGDHIIVNGPRFVLCSPSGLVDDPALDVAAFHPLIELLCLRWEASPRYGDQGFDRWRDVGRSSTEPGLSAHRLAARLAALARP